MILETENLVSKYHKPSNGMKDFLVALIENRAQEVGLAIYNVQNGCFLVSQVKDSIIVIYLLNYFLDIR